MLNDSRRNSPLPCPCCGGRELENFFAVADVPVFCNVLWPSREAALGCDRGNIQLLFCQGCGAIFNSAFDPRLVAYSPNYENSLHHSKKFQDYAEGLAQRLVANYQLKNKRIVEIGCGNGDFLKLLCSLGDNQGLGFDPGFSGNHVSANGNLNIEIVRDYFDARYSQVQADFISCRHVLEHLQRPAKFLSSLRQTLGERTNTILYFEVPNVFFTLRDLAIWDIIYEHVLYFHAGSLASLFHRSGFEILKVYPAFDEQYLAIEAKPDESEPICQKSPQIVAENNQRATEYIQAFTRRYKEKFSAWRTCLEEHRRQGKRVVAWGAGSKGVTFLNLLNDCNDIPAIVDINPRKLGKHIAGSGQKVIAPQELAANPPDAVIVMNPTYTAEIKQTLTTLGLSLQLLVDASEITVFN